MKRRMLPAVLVGLLLAIGSQEVQGQLAFGPQLNVATDTDFGIGGRLLANIRRTDLEAVASFDIYFPEGPADFWELNANLFYHFHLRNTENALPYLGGGLNIGHLSDGRDRTEVGLNLAGGVRFPIAARLAPFVELRGVVASDFDQLVATFGLLFGHVSGR